MRISTKLKIYFYTVILLIIGIILIYSAIGFINTGQIALALQALSAWNIRLAIGLTGLLLILISFLYHQIMFSRVRREKTIAFQTANGEVLVALNAVEDLIRRIAVEVEGIKEARPDIIASKRGLEINLRLILYSEVNIPEFTDRIQEMIKSRIQEMLGLDEEIVIKIFVAKIVGKEQRVKKRKETEPEEITPPPVPFQGYKR